MMKTTKLSFITILVLTIIVSFYLGRVSKKGIVRVTNYENKHILDSIKYSNDSIILVYQDTINSLLDEIDSIDKTTVIYKYREHEEIDNLPSYNVRQLDSIAFSNTSRYNMLRNRRSTDISSE